MAPVSTNIDQVGPDSTLWKKSKFLFSSFLTLCFYLEWIAYFFLLLFHRKMNRKIRTNNVFCCVHCHSLIYFLCSCLQLLKIISLECKQRHYFTCFYVSILFIQLKLSTFICYSIYVIITCLVFLVMAIKEPEPFHEQNFISKIGAKFVYSNLLTYHFSPG